MHPGIVSSCPPANQASQTADNTIHAFSQTTEKKEFKRTQYTCSVLQNTSSNSLWFGKKGNDSRGLLLKGQGILLPKIVQLFTFLFKKRFGLYNRTQIMFRQDKVIVT